jgi:hypothetical protein
MRLLGYKLQTLCVCVCAHPLFITQRLKLHCAYTHLLSFLHLQWLKLRKQTRVTPEKVPKRLGFDNVVQMMHCVLCVRTPPVLFAVAEAAQADPRDPR